MHDKSSSNPFNSLKSDLEKLAPPAKPAILDHIVEQRLISPLSRPSRTSVTQGFITKSLSEISEIFDAIAGPQSRTTNTLRCLSYLNEKLYSTDGNFTATLPVKTCLETPFFAHYQTIRAISFKENSWLTTLGNGVVSTQLHQAIKKPVLSTEEQISWGLHPIPDTQGLMAFSTTGAAQALLGTQNIYKVVDRARNTGADRIRVRYQEELFNIDVRILGFHAPSIGSSLIANNHDLQVFQSSEFPLKSEYRPRFFMSVSHAAPVASSPSDDATRAEQLSDKLQALTVAASHLVDDFFGWKSEKHIVSLRTLEEDLNRAPSSQAAHFDPNNIA